MKKLYISPDLEVVRITLMDVLNSPIEDIGNNNKIVDDELPGGSELDDL